MFYQSEFKMALTIGKTKLEYGLMLAPMAGFSDRAMRLVCRKHGAEYSVSEMVSAKAIVYGDKKTAKLAKIEADDSPTAIQLFGSEPDTVAEAAAIASSGAFGGVLPAAIDINMGCPVPKIYKNGEGSALMKSPRLIEKIVSRVTEKTELPCTVKLRLGLERSSLNVLDCAKAAEAGGAALVAIHGRTKSELYSGEASYEETANVKRALQIPVVANGDITSAEKALRVISDTGADGIMIGRGAVGNPFIFSEIKAALSGEGYTPPTLAKRIETALLQLRLAILDKGEELAVREARGQLAHYLFSFRGAAAFRGEINRAKTYLEIEEAFSRVLDANA